MAERLDLVQSFGSHSLAYSTLQAGMQYFDTTHGYIAYREHTSFLGKTVAVLGDPIAPPGRINETVRQFASQFEHANYWQISKQPAGELADRGYFVNEAGLDSLVDLQAFTGNWRTHKSLRRETNKAIKHGVIVIEKSLDEVPICELREISNSWLAGQRNQANNQSFLTRPLVLVPEPDVRFFFAYQRDKLVGFRVFDPVYCNKAILGYYADAVRVSKDAPPGTSYKIMFDAIRMFKKEGKRILTLGYSPFAETQYRCKFNSSPLTHCLFKFAFNHLEKVYSQKGISNHKRRFHGAEQKVYFASKSLLPLKDIINTCYLTGINLPRQLVCGVR